MNPITSTNGRITVVPNYDKTHYVLGPIKMPEFRDRQTLDRLHEQRLTRSARKAQEWADRVEALLP